MCIRSDSETIEQQSSKETHHEHTTEIDGDAGGGHGAGRGGIGAGGEDFFNQAWGMQPSAFLHNGSSIHESNTGGYQTSYVHHLENPVRFDKEIKVTIEHGHGNHLGNEMASVAYWYAETPAAAVAIPPVEKRQRVPKVDGKFVIRDDLRWPGHELHRK